MNLWNKLRLKPINALLVSQFWSAFADNAILFAIIEMLRAKAYPESYIGNVQQAFLFAYVVLAPFVGSFADKHPKSVVLLIGNALKALGIVGLLLGLEPALSYAVIGIGAAVYSPAKYGILGEILSRSATDAKQLDSDLLKANAKIEGYTIIAILAGTVGGGILAKQSLTVCIVACLLLYVTALLLSLSIPRVAGNPNIHYVKDSILFFKDIARLFRDRTARYCLIGTSSFWMTSSVIRVAVISWIPLHLGIHGVDQISMLIAVTAIGIMAGALTAPKLVPAHKFLNSYVYGVVMVVLILVFPMLGNLYVTVFILLAVGFAGGVYVVPLNSVLQKVGNPKIGAGKTIAVQNLFENVLMFAGVRAYTQATAAGTSVETSIYGVGLVLALFVLYLVFQAVMLKRRSAAVADSRA
ncbi:lysophospholipid transporter LplT [Paenibacillus tyrfis]|uniref:lysophospholipid transporter LplT n=1 Tax=Paenibacillus tyrfis TaxID=1501230 RepID=UPI000B58F8A8|nr:lysophospholipid transporter LplT [Paenibacillus tyrfis]